MRVALTIESFRSGPGGAEASAFALARELAGRRVDLTIVCREASRETIPGVRVEPLGGPKFWQPWRVRAFSRRAARATRGRFDVVQAYSRTRHQDVYRAGGGSHADYLEAMYRFPRLQRALSPRHRTLLALEAASFADPAQLVLCNSRRAADEIARRYGVTRERLAVIYNGVDTERFAPGRHAPAARELRQALGIDGPLALFLGSGFERKGLDRAIDGLARAGAKVTLLVAGRGDARTFGERAAARGVSERVRFVGAVADPAPLLGAADLFVLPTRYDPFANACLEAMAAGIPVATTPQNGASELLVAEESGFVLEDDFAPAFRALDDLGRLRRMGVAARAVAEHYTWSAHTDAVLALWARRFG